MVKLVVNADDFGLTSGINKAIIEAHENGIVNSATIMMNGLATEEAISYSLKHPSLGVGVHLVLTYGKPLLDNVRSLMNMNGNFHSLSLLNECLYDIKLEELEQEWDTQIQKFLSSGLQPTHLDSHHHVHLAPALHPVIRKLTKKYSLPVRLFNEMKIEGVTPFTDLFLGDFYDKGVTPYYFDKFEEYAADVVIEIMTHPGYADDQLKEISSYVVEREKELFILQNIKLPKNVSLVEWKNKVDMNIK